MGIFGSILSKIFPPSHPAAAAATGPGAPPAAPAAGATTMPEVDVVSVLSGLAQKTSEKLNWRTSIVDLMKLLGLDSSLTARKELAKELHFTGDVSDSASMNTWLQKQVMKKLAENGGKVPDDLKN